MIGCLSTGGPNGRCPASPIVSGQAIALLSKWYREQGSYRKPLLKQWTVMYLHRRPLDLSWKPRRNHWAAIAGEFGRVAFNGTSASIIELALSSEPAPSPARLAYLGWPLTTLAYSAPDGARGRL
jgi:hypothetical protein